LQPLGCNVLACDLLPNPQQNDIVEFVDLDTLLHNSDAITLHVPAMPMNHHTIDAEQFAMMR
jgi:lactate dehydrogenase-like 2-hydroxyacid dehydrogenase